MRAFFPDHTHTWYFGHGGGVGPGRRLIQGVEDPYFAKLIWAVDHHIGRAEARAALSHLLTVTEVGFMWRASMTGLDTSTLQSRYFEAYYDEKVSDFENSIAVVATKPVEPTGDGRSLRTGGSYFSHTY